jgi:hypothetical protein
MAAHEVSGRRHVKNREPETSQASLTAMCKRRDTGQFSRLLSQYISAYLHDIAQEAEMLAAIAVVLFVIGFIVNAANVATPALFSPISFLLAGLVCLAIHLTGAAPAWSTPRWRR